MYSEKVHKYIRDNNLLNGGEHIVAGVSGGADSVCMLYILMGLSGKYGLKLTVVHVHHGIRGKEADDDMEFVGKICENHNIEFCVFEYDVPQMAKKERLSIEEAGRAARYEAFNRVLEEKGADYIAVAHNANDHAETILFNMCRGAGIYGIKGILPKRDRIIRPILILDRAEILELLHGSGIEYRMDSTNESHDYIRNRIRNVVIPYLNENINEKASEHIGKIGSIMASACDYLDIGGKEAYDKICTGKDAEKIILDSRGLCGLHPAIAPIVVRNAIEEAAGRLKDITSCHIDDVLHIAAGNTGKKTDLPYGLEAVRSNENLIIRKKTGIEEELPDVKISGEGRYDFAKNGFVVAKYDEYKNVIFEEKTYTKWMNCDILNGNLHIRTRRNGDYIVVNDSGGKKKLKDYFIDEKIPRQLRGTIPLIADGHEILWIIGYRMSEKYKIKSERDSIVKMQYHFCDKDEYRRIYGREDQSPDYRGGN